MEDGLGEVIIRSGVNAANDAFGIATRRQDEDGRFVGSFALANSLTQIDTIHPRHHHIQYNQIGECIFQDVERGMSITSLEYVETTPFKHDADESQRADFVVND